MSPPSGDGDEDLVPISALQHYVFCPRQCALIHVERIWAEDGATTEGRLLHERVDGGKADRRRGVRVVRGLELRSFLLGVVGKADAVEFHRTGDTERPYPVEHKRGRPKSHRADEVQLCAQAICLEEMRGTPVPQGALFYGQTRRRLVVTFDEQLRALTLEVARNVRTLLAMNHTPLPVLTRACKHCSLVDICQPEKLQRPPVVAQWLAGQVGA